MFYNDHKGQTLPIASKTTALCANSDSTSFRGFEARGI